MLSASFLAVASLLTPALALPYASLQPRQVVTLNESSVPVPQVINPTLNVTYSSPVNSSLPNVVIFATGGTIAGSSKSATDSTNYQAGVIGVEALVQAVPQMLNVSNIIGSQVANTASGNINSTILLTMAKLANDLLCSENSTTAGIVITHGTDSLEETAFAMDAMVNCDKPVVLVGAMRPATAISADGPANLLEAVTLAASPSAKGRGGLVVLNDRIASAWYVQKTNANALDTFRSVEQGYVGGFLSTVPFFYYPAAQPSFKRPFDISNVTSLPRVAALLASQEFDGSLVTAAVDLGYRGIVIGGMGAGAVPSVARPAIAAALAAGVPVVLSTKTGAGAVVPSAAGEADANSTIASGFLSPNKARIQLQLALATGMDMAQIRESFEGTLASYLY